MARTAARQGEIDSVGVEQRLFGERTQSIPAPIEGCLQLVTGLVRELTDAPPTIGVERSQRLLSGAER